MIDLTNIVLALTLTQSGVAGVRTVQQGSSYGGGVCKCGF